jgi:hypothetical protein
MYATDHPKSSAPPDPRRWTALALLAIADFVVVLDATIVNVALPSIGRTAASARPSAWLPSWERPASPSQQSPCLDAVDRCLWRRFPRRSPSLRPFLLVTIAITD